MSAFRSNALVALAACVLCACGARDVPPLVAGPLPPELATRLPQQNATEQANRKTVVAAATRMLSDKKITARGLTFSPDPVGFARAAYWEVGIDLVADELADEPKSSGMALLFRTATAKRWLHTDAPSPGELVFFDAVGNEDSAPPTQIAIVEEAHSDGTIVMVGYFAQGPARIVMNLREPELVVRSNGERVNDLLGADAPTPAAQLFRSFADPYVAE